MKQGSADDPFAEEPTDADGDGGTADEAESIDTTAEPESHGIDRSADTADAREDDGADADRSGSANRGAAETANADRDDGGSTARGKTQRQSLPYIHARDGVKDGRTQRPVFLRDHVEAGIDELVAEMETELGEDVYKTDVTEAAMAVAQENPELVLAKLKEWGYGWT